VFDKISKDIRNRYTLAYAPDETSDKRVIRTIKVAANESGRKLIVHTRRKYSIIPYSKSVPDNTASVVQATENQP
jgi:hypothetical protein